MRIIAGIARGHPLKAARTRDLRPTSDLVRGAIFDIVGPYFTAETRVLDLYAGTGALGIEALSRGAGWADFVEKNTRCCAVLRENLEHTGFNGSARVYCKPVHQTLHLLTGPYGLVFLDPPYAQALDATVFETLVLLELVQQGSLAVVEHASRNPVLPAYGKLHLIKERQHGDTNISVFAVEGENSG
ncbi:MAG TPA: 16S rRNA (guanine(966)-N(2))-methyltransferase RsmD [Dehalococcoidia bacterium]|nr:16S rRNA (guanine(966)-N(2))-methyltransferase RsmD [Dehalococcoidia bacterium]